METASLTAIDVHVHVEGDGHGHYSMDDELLAASSAYFRTGGERAPTVEQIAALYREQQMMAVIFTVDATTAMGHPALSSEEIADRAAKFADVLIPFGSVDPLVPDEAVRRARREASRIHASSSGSPAARLLPVPPGTISVSIRPRVSVRVAAGTIERPLVVLSGAGSLATISTR